MRPPENQVIFTQNRNLITCPGCGRRLITEELKNHLCIQDASDQITKLDFYDIPLVIKVDEKERIMAETPDGRLYVLVFHRPRKSSPQNLK